MIQEYLPVLLQIIVAIGFAASALLVSMLLGKTGKRTPTKDTPYECGMIPQGEGVPRFSVKFYLVAMVFILFDVEAIFLYPWAYIFKDLARNVETRWFGFIEMMLYVAILFVGYIYLWKKGALDWHKTQK